MKEQLKHVDRDCLEEVLIGIPYKGETMKTQKRNLKQLIGTLKKNLFRARSLHIFLPKFSASTFAFKLIATIKVYYLKYDRLFKKYLL
tara:strand:+ start:356 stop:619 length:264 start_codon:yes stop_codon:yes gene_type:complete